MHGVLKFGFVSRNGIIIYISDILKMKESWVGLLPENWVVEFFEAVLLKSKLVTHYITMPDKRLGIQH